MISFAERAFWQLGESLQTKTLGIYSRSVLENISSLLARPQPSETMRERLLSRRLAEAGDHVAAKRVSEGHRSGACPEDDALKFRQLYMILFKVSNEVIAREPSRAYFSCKNNQVVAG